MLREIPNKEVNKLWEILNAEDQDQITKDEATDLGFTYLIEQGFTPSSGNVSLPEIYLNMVSENMKALVIPLHETDDRYSKESLAVKVQEAMGSETEIKLSKVDDGGLISDFAFICGIFENYGYVDIYFVKAYNGLIVTEVSVSDE